MSNLIKNFEGLRLAPYLCPANVATIGFGNTRYQDGTRVTMNDKPLTLEQAEALFSFYHNQFKASVKKRVKSDINDNQLEALTSFAYNVGLGNLDKSTLLKKVNLNPKDPTIKAEFLKWNKGGGKVLNGLVKRREAESALYFVL
jgi:lysozyme